MALKNATKLPSIKSLLISAGPAGDQCNLCGNSFEIHDSSKSTLPCVDFECEPCARMWRILRSPTCSACYADFTCPGIAKDRTQIPSPLLDLDANDTLQQQSPSDSQLELFLSFQDRYVAFYGADTDSDDDTISEPGSPIREEADEITSVGEISDERLREALILANNRAGTNFCIQEIEAEVSMADLRTSTKIQLADTLTQFCIRKASESDEDDARDESSRQLDENDPSDAKFQQGRETTQEDLLRCVYCHKAFRNESHLRQHAIIHAPSRRTCSICGQVLGNPSSRRVHERKHRETEKQRDERLRQEREARDRKRAAQKVQKQNRRERLRGVSG
ncbi:MAG: hypothetical protein ALECFALPRED_000954 [Alectoria fallacina]|uniref:C2H2-type domain-containing protein n=1 Tax=Alectoria fallacina TaxID=1903189 RepID=A0A8H3PLB7_9LECA|nr:MAG: hypothetical protein ALECFALPRED_000954 [Alectoria fallacina]